MTNNHNDEAPEWQVTVAGIIHDAKLTGESHAVTTRKVLEVVTQLSNNETDPQHNDKAYAPALDWIGTGHNDEVERVVALLCRTDNHVSGNSGNSNKYAIKKSSLHKALQAIFIAGVDAVAEGVPEKGIKWMQEGHSKQRVGYTDGFNECHQAILDHAENIKREVNNET